MSIYGVWPQSRNSISIMLVGFVLLMFGFQASAQQHVNDNFDGTGALIGYTTNNPKSLEKVGRVDGRYRALIDIGDNERNITLHFNSRQGRLDAKRVRFPFEYIARNIGIGAKENSQTAPAGRGSRYIFAGIQVHDVDLNLRNSSHIVVGHRGGTHFTLEGKSTVNGRSRVNDLGAGVAPSGRADLRVVGNADNTLTVFWQRPNLSPDTVSDSWTLYRGAGNLPTPESVYGDEVYIGLITYAQGSRGLPFVGTSDAIEFTELSSPVTPRNPPTEEDDTQPPGTPSEGNIEIILDNGDSGTSSTGRWLNASAASLHYGRMSLYGRVGSGVDSYRFTPTIVTAGEYDVYEWNSCYSPRASDVPHEIVYAGGRTTIDVNQDCSSGVTGAWNHLGAFPFSAGNSGYVEISDNGITDTAGRYLGADAIRFVMTTASGETGTPENTAPVLDPIANMTVNEGESVRFNPIASDAEGDSLTFSYSGWMRRSSYITNFGDAGVYTVAVTVSDGELTDSQNVVVTVNDTEESESTPNDDTQPPGTPSEGNIEIILDNGDSGTSSTGRWLNASAASLHYGRMSLYGRVGSGVDSYRFTPTIVTAGEYDVYEWNSCYSPRASDVPHEIVYAGGRTTIDVNQDCSSGVTGAWNHLGAFPFSAGNSGYVEISDNGITDTAGRYLGADAIRFVMTTVDEGR